MGKFSDGVLRVLGIDKLVKNEVNKSMEGALNEYQLVEIQQDKQFKYRQVENQIWFRGNPSDLEKFYKQKRSPNEQPNNFFWRAVDSKTVKIHYPLASSISRHMSAILFGDDIKMTIDTKQESLSEEMNKRLDDILKENNVRELLQKGAILESYSGSLGAKIVLDPNFSDYPQIQLYPAEQIDVKTKYGKVYEITFKDEYRIDQMIYTLKSVYGKGYIHYSLHDKNGRRVALDVVPELSELKDILFLAPDGNPIKLMMAVFKPNKVVNNEFSDTPFGESDYSGLYGIFNALDELISAWNDYYRNGKIITFLSEDMLEREPMTGKVLPINKFGINDVILYDATTNNSKLQDVRRDIPEMDITPFREGFKNLIETALQRAGLSPISFGIEAVSVISSGETLNVREKTTLKTRMDKIKLWKEFLSRMMKLVFIFDSLKEITPTISEDVITYRLKDDFGYEFMAEFPQYNMPTREEQIKILAASLAGKLIDIETAVKELYKDEYTEEQLEEIAENIKKENGIGMVEEEEMPSPEDMNGSMEVREESEEVEEEMPEDDSQD